MCGAKNYIDTLEFEFNFIALELPIFNSLVIIGAEIIIDQYIKSKKIEIVFISII